MRAIHRAALAGLGIDAVAYRVNGEDDLPMICGLALSKDGEEFAWIEQVPRGWGGDGRWYVMDASSKEHEDLLSLDDLSSRAVVSSRTQREALANVIEIKFRVIA